MNIKNIIRNNAKLYMILSIIILFGTVGVSLAVLTSNFNAISINTNMLEIDADISYDEGSNGEEITSTGNMLPISDSLVTGPNVTDSRVLKATFNVTGNNNNPDNTIYDIALHNVNIDCALRTKDLKWRLYKGEELISREDASLSPTFDTIDDGRLVLTETQEDLTTSTDKYTFLLWISESCDGNITECDSSKDQSDYLGKEFSASIKVELSTKNKKQISRITGSEDSCYYTEVEVPICNTITYNGQEQQLVNTASSSLSGISGDNNNYNYKMLPLGISPLTNTNYYSIKNNIGVNAGKYAVILKLEDGYKWTDGSTNEKCIYCSIDKKDINITTLDQEVMYGNKVSSEVNDINVSRLIIDDTVEEVSLTSDKSDVGEGTIISNNIKIVNSNAEDVTSNYNIIKNNTGKLTITCANIAKEPTITNLAYTGNLQSGISGGTYITITGEKSATEIGEYKVTAVPNKNYCWSDKTTTSKEYTWKIKSNSLNIEIEDKTTIYTGEEVTIDKAVVTDANEKEITDIPITYKYYSGTSCTGDTLSSAPINVGSYSVKGYIEKTESYPASESNCAKLTITKASGSISASTDSLSLTYPTGGSFTYTYTGDGNISCSSSSDSIATCAVDKANKKVTVTPKTSGSATVTVTLAQGTNYTEASDSVSISITYDTYTITLNNQSATSAGTTAIYGRYSNGIFLDSSYSKSMTTSSNAITIPTRTGYTFGGYYTSTGESGIQLISANGYITSSFTNTLYKDNVTLYAKWIANTAKVTINKDGSAYSGLTVALYQSNTSKYSSPSSSSGVYTFGIVANGTYDVYVGGSDTGTDISVSSTGTATINYYTLTLSKGTGISSVSGAGTYLSGTKISISATASTGYTFSSWTKSEGTSPASTSAASTTVTIAAKTTLTANAVDITKPGTPTITRSDYNTFTYTATDGVGVTCYYVSTSSTTPTAGTCGIGTGLNVWSTVKTKDVSSAGTYYVWARDAAGNVSSAASIGAYTISRSQGAGTSLTTRYDSTSSTGGTAFTSSTVMLKGTNVWASTSANTGYNTPTLKHGSTKMTASGSSFTVSATESIASSATINTYTVTIYYFTVPNSGVAQPLTTTTHTLNYGTNYTPKYEVSTPSGYHTVYAYEYYNSSGYVANYDLGSSFTVKENVKLHMYYYIDTYTISYNANGGSGAPSVQTKIYNDTLTLSSTKPTRTGYTFLGWSTNSSATSATYEAGGSYTSNSSVTLYAIWSPIQYTISYDLAGGSVSGNPTSYTIDTSIFTLNNPTRTGYTFLRWKDNQDQIYYLNKEEGVEISGDGITITNSKSGNTFNNAKIQILSSSGSFITQPAALGTVGSTSGSYYHNLSSGNYMVAIKANGSTADYGVYYNAYLENGVTYICELTNTVATSQQYKIKNVRFYKQGSNNTGLPIETISKGSYGNKNYTALWRVNTYTITYNLDGGTVSGNPTSYNIETNNFTLNNPTRTGYTFLGWRENQDKMYLNSKNQEVTISGNEITITNSKSGNTFNNAKIQLFSSSGSFITLLAELSTVGSTSGSYYHNLSSGNYMVGIKTNGKAKDYGIYYNVYLEQGATYICELTNTVATSQQYKIKNVRFYKQGANNTGLPIETISKGSYGNKSYTALWQINTYTVTQYHYYYYQNSSWTHFNTTTDSRNYGSSFAPYNVTPPTGYYAGNNYGYYDSNSTYIGGGTVGSNSFTVTQDTLVDVHYYPNTYTVSYNANGGSGAPGSQTKYYATPLTLSSTTPTRTNYTFLGWSTSSTATSATYSAGGSYTANSGATLYAVWKINISETASASAVTGLKPRTYAQTGVTGQDVDWTGTTSATFAGTYTAYATPKANYAWPGGGTEKRTITWTISPVSKGDWVYLSQYGPHGGLNFDTGGAFASWVYSTVLYVKAIGNDGSYALARSASDSTIGWVWPNDLVLSS